MPTRPPRWLFVCSGNICRSPMARALAAWEADRRGIALELDSAGTLGIVGEPMDPKAVQVALEIGLTVEEHASKALTPALLGWADRVLVMTDAHLASVGLLSSEAVDRVVPLGRLVGLEEIADPHGSWFLGPYRRCRDDLRRAIAKLADGPAARPVPT